MTAPASLVVIAFGNPHLLEALLRSLAGHPDAALFERIVVVDNGFPRTGDSRLVPVPPALRDRMRYVQHDATSYSAGVNAGVAATDTPVVLVGNNDLEWRPGLSVAPLLAALDLPDVAVAGPQLEYPDGSWQRSGGPFPSPARRLLELALVEVVRSARAARAHPAGGPPRDVGYVDGALFAVRRDRFDALGGFDPDFGFYGEDLDFRWRARARGWRRLLVPTARLVHLRGATSAPSERPESTARLFQATIRFVARTQGDGAARRFRLLTRLHARLLADLYAVARALRPGAAWDRRLAIARLSVRATGLLPRDVRAAEVRCE